MTKNQLFENSKAGLTHWGCPLQSGNAHDWYKLCELSSWINRPRMAKQAVTVAMAKENTHSEKHLENGKAGKTL